MKCGRLIWGWSETGKIIVAQMAKLATNVRLKHDRNWINLLARLIARKEATHSLRHAFAMLCRN